jgi:hypothetical protein
VKPVFVPPNELPEALQKSQAAADNLPAHLTENLLAFNAGGSKSVPDAATSQGDAKRDEGAMRGVVF